MSNKGLKIFRNKLTPIIRYNPWPGKRNLALIKNIVSKAPKSCFQISGLLPIFWICKMLGLRGSNHEENQI